jgi:predicted RNA-binding Zn ribbon-like protein
MMAVMEVEDRPAPGRLELIRGFVNTLDLEHASDQLSDAAGASRWLAAAHLPGAGPELDDAGLARLVAVREALRQLLLANNAGERPSATALAVLNEQSEAAIGLHFSEDGGAQLVTHCRGVDAAIAELLAIVHEAIHDDSWRRLKVCPADDCRWAFYDHSRNRSGTWCDMGDCGNRAKARAYRERHRHTAGR